MTKEFLKSKEEQEIENQYLNDQRLVRINEKSWIIVYIHDSKQRKV